MKRLLFIDDEPELTEVVREYLHDSYDVVIANSGASALASVPPDAAGRHVPRHQHARTHRDRGVEGAVSL